MKTFIFGIGLVLMLAGMAWGDIQASVDPSNDIADLPDLPYLDRLYLCNTSVTGDISDLPDIPSPNRLYYNDTSIVGNIGNL